ncbi:MAG: acyl-CoA dehydrogenase [Porticoccaceae bacterium]|nr:acyl-CoA dehydrogenase [Pseudomonadales bacterium]MCP5171746.1 acyl-CoA dehydrogenase [Pseudomonadales bacterium]
MTIYKAPVEDMSFLLNHVLGMDEISRLPGYEEATPDMVAAILTEAARFFDEVVAPTNMIADREGLKLEGNQVITPPSLDGVYQQMVDAGWQSLAGDPQYGGQGMPQLLSFVVDEMCQSANLSFSLCPLLTKGVITALSRYGSEQQKIEIIPKLMSGQWSGTMNLTEPQAGSDLAAITTKAVPNGDHYLISGQKIYITWGEHDYSENIIHLVLARTPDAPEGVKGISLFVVPKVLEGQGESARNRNDVYCIGLEEKLGIHASPTCTMSYGENGGAVGYLVGKENEGLSYMFAMMNHARQSVGLQGVAIAERAYQQAVDYARERVQGDVPGKSRVTIINHPDVRRMLMTMRALTEGGRALAYSSMAHEDLSEKAENEQQSAYHQRRVDLLTPLVKGWCTDVGLEVASLGIQVHGGMGFIEETGAAQHMRDARILPIYEGTNGIQSLDLVGRKILRDKGMAATELVVEWSEILTEVEAAGEEMAPIARALKAGITDCSTAVKALFKAAVDDWAAAEAGAYNALMLMGTTAAGALLAKSALAAVKLNEAGQGNKDFNDAKIITANFFAQYVMARNSGYVAAVQAGPENVMALAEEAF